MAESGFDYVPVEPSLSPGDDGTLTADGYRERFGYGMLVSWEESLTGDPVDVDPNQALLAEMDEATRLAWDTALYGAPEARDDPDQREGCQPQAEHAAYAYKQTDAWTQLEPLLYGIVDRAVADPRAAEADRDWSACMAEAGFQFEDSLDLLAFIDETLFDTWMEQTPPPGEDPPEQRFAPEAWFVETDAWQDLVQLELEIAELDAACQQGVQTELFLEYQERFIDENQELLVQLQDEVAELLN